MRSSRQVLTLQERNGVNVFVSRPCRKKYSDPVTRKREEKEDLKAAVVAFVEAR